MEHLIELGVFIAKIFVVTGGIVTVIIVLAAIVARAKHRPDLEIENLNEKYKMLEESLTAEILPKKEFKNYLKQEKKAAKNAEKKSAKSDAEPRPRAFVLKFDGDIQASQTESLREEISAILQIATPQDEVVVRLESPGGQVTGYGLASAQLVRIREKKIKLTVCVDQVAASGGYMMACVANQILAAPFAVVGSIGVVASLPNFHRILQKNDVDYLEVTSGQFKRTVSLLGQITPPGLEKFKSQIEETHVLFKDYVKHYRPQLDMEQIATGEHWYGTQAIEKKLVDQLITSDDYLLKLKDTSDLYQITFSHPKSWMEKLSQSAALAAGQVIQKQLQILSKNRYGHS